MKKNPDITKPCDNEHTHKSLGPRYIAVLLHNGTRMQKRLNKFLPSPMDPTDRICRDGVLCWRLEIVASSVLRVEALCTKKSYAYPIFQSISINCSICTIGILLDII